MDELTLKKELSLLLCHYLKKHSPVIYENLSIFCEKKGLLPLGCENMNFALENRFANFKEDQFLLFLRSLRPSDDFPSIFRRITTFNYINNNINKKDLQFFGRIYCHKDHVYCIIIDPLSRILITGSDDSTIKVWKLPNFELIITFYGHEGFITNLCLNPLCTILLSSSNDKTLRLWSLKSGQIISVLSGFTYQAINYCTFNSSGSMIVAACEDGSIPIWSTSDAIQGKSPLRILKSPGQYPVGWVSFSPGGEFLVYSSEPSNIVVIILKNLSNNNNNLDFHQNTVDFVTFTNNYYSSGVEYGPKIISISKEEGAVYVSQLENGKWKYQHVFKQQLVIGRRNNKILRTGISVDEHILLIATQNGVFICDLFNGEVIGQINDLNSSIECKCIVGHPLDFNLFLIANSNGNIAIIDILLQKCISEIIIPGEPSFIDAVWNHNGEFIYLTDVNGSIILVRYNNVIKLNPFEIEIFEEIDLNTNKKIFKDKNGKILNNKPNLLDIRNLDLSLNLLESTLLYKSALELRLISRLLSGEITLFTRHHTASIVPPPPQHIKMTIEQPINPHGENLNINKDNNIEENNSSNIQIESDIDEWILDPSLVENQNSIVFSSLVRAESVPLGPWPDWSVSVLCDDNIYLPQIGDEVFFIKDSNNFIIEELQLKNFNSLSKIQRCTIVELIPFDKSVKLKLVFPNSTAFHINIEIPIPDINYSLIPLNKFKTSIEYIKTLKPLQKILILKRFNNFKLSTFFGIIKSINSFETDPFKSIEIELENKEIILISPWDIYIYNNKISNISDRFYDAMFTLSKSIDIILTDESYLPFKHINTNIESLTPMSLMFLKERLENCWYHSNKSLVYDIRLLKSNLKDNETLIPIADKLVQNLIIALEKFIKPFNDRRPKQPPLLPKK